MSIVQSKIITAITLLLEALLIFYYFNNLLPAYNLTQYKQPNVAPGNNPSCSLFVTQIEAQNYYTNNKDKIASISSLDHDKDGIVCENLP